MSMSQENYLEFPVKVKPRLPGGNIHRMRIDENGVEIRTWPGLYGNRESSLVLAIARSEIMEAEYKRPLLTSGTGHCGIRYLTESGEEQSLKFHAVDQGVLSGNMYAQQRQNSYTEAVAEALMGVKKAIVAYRLCHHLP